MATIRQRTEARDTRFIQPLVEPFQEFIHAQSTGGVLLLVATVMAMIWANSPWAESYAEFWNTPVSIR